MADKEKSFGPKPLMDATLVTEFGGVEDLESFKADGASQRDYTWVPGFSQMRVDRDLALGALHRQEIRAKDVPILPVNLRWFRRVRGTGSDPDQMKTAHAKNMGYRAATQADIGQAWLTTFPPGAIEEPDGTITTAAGDNVLMVASGQVAARNAMQKKIATEAMVDGMQFSNDLMRVGSQVRGASPVVEKKTVEVTK